MIAAARAQNEDLNSLLQWARPQPFLDLKIFGLLGIAEGLSGIDNTVCCMGYPFEMPFETYLPNRE